MRAAMELNQENFPRIWLAFQLAIGGLKDKRALVLSRYKQQKNILEVGCSVGVIADIFRNKDVCYTGVDIDANAIAFAKRRFADDKKFTFLCEDVKKLASNAGEKFDFILFSSVLHHIEEEECVKMIKACASMSGPKTEIVIIEPVMPSQSSQWLAKIYVKYLEKGHFVRTREEWLRLFKRVNELCAIDLADAPVVATPFPGPVCANVVVLTGHFAQ
jgi:2-polyprenyl-3-methyl-5-hydroxy-6-metoxy-1,4-benzoquinol methylase